MSEQVTPRSMLEELLDEWHELPERQRRRRYAAFAHGWLASTPVVRKPFAPIRGSGA